MANSITVSITGDKFYDQLFRELPNRVERQAIRKACRAGAKLICEEARTRAPVKSGVLKRNIKVRAGRRKRAYISMEVITKDGFFKGEAFYGAFQEFGTSHQRARPFMRPAFAATGKKALELTRNELKTIIVDEWNKLHAGAPKAP